MTEIPVHLRKRAEAARAKAEAEKGEAVAAAAPVAEPWRRFAGIFSPSSAGASVGAPPPLVASSAARRSCARFSR